MARVLLLPLLLAAVPWGPTAVRAQDDDALTFAEGPFPPESLELFEAVEGVERATEGDYATLNYTATFTKDGAPYSLWMDVPLFSGPTGMVNFWPEIAKGRMEKMELFPKEDMHPIKQDTRTVQDANGTELYERTRYIAYGPYPVTYGALPQTLEDPTAEDPMTGYIGDSDPMDAFDIGDSVPPVGLPYTLKVLGSLAMIDGGETDWKVVGINAKDPLAESYNDITDVPPEKLEMVHKFYRDYKTAVGKPQNEFWQGDDGGVATTAHWVNRTVTEKAIEHSHEQWNALVKSCAKEGSGYEKFSVTGADGGPAATCEARK